MLDGLHEDLNRVRDKPVVPSVESDATRPDAEVAAEAWVAHCQRNDSRINDLFGGQLKVRRRGVSLTSCWQHARRHPYAEERGGHKL